MHITDVHLKQFRCFSSLHLAFTSPIVLIEGSNGSGKTSLLEALYYAGHMRSFKTSTPKEMIYHENDSFFIKVAGESANPNPAHPAIPPDPVRIACPSNASIALDALGTKGIALTPDPAHPEPVEGWTIQAGYSQQKKNIKINETPAKTYQDLYATYRTISITEDDMALVHGSPENRRTFLDQGLSFMSVEYRALLKRYRRVLDQRNALLAGTYVSDDSYTLWTEQLADLTADIQIQRTQLLADLEAIVNSLLKEHFSREGLPAISLLYTPKHAPGQTVDKGLELRVKKTLFGAHLDDFAFFLHNQSAKTFASRGQQKLLTLLIKIAIGIRDNQSHILLLDDFVTDFDETRISTLVRLLHASNAQIIFTIPVQKSVLHDTLKEYPHQIITLAQTDTAISSLK